MTPKKLTVAERKLHNQIDDIQYDIDHLNDKVESEKTKMKALLKKRRALMDRLERK